MLRALAVESGLADRVHFLGALAPEELKVPLSAADVFVLASSYEGWANVFLEAMACGLPVVTTDVGGNAEVVASGDLGAVVPYGDGDALEEAISSALVRPWNREAIRRHAETQSWDARIPRLLAAFELLLCRAAQEPHSLRSNAEHV